jgi:hypothetical protein
MRYLLLLGVLAVAILATPHAGHISAGVLAAFDGFPAAPLPFSQHPEYAGYDVQVHSRSPQPWAALHPMQAEHGPNCSAPPASHSTSAYADAVYICNDHLMTAINGEEYGLIVLTPNKLFNFSNGGAITFELSTKKMSKRDWWDITITPYAENLALPLLSDLSQGVDLQGPPRNAIVIASDDGVGAPRLKVMRNGVLQRYHDGVGVPALGQGVVAGTNQGATRQSFRFTAANGRMKFERLASSTAPALVYWDVVATATFTSGVVQFGHHSYDPSKDGAGSPATWHWDNLDAQPSTPFTILHAAPRQLTSAGTVTFPPAPAGAHLRFGALCRPVVNGVAATRQPSADSVKYEHASSYWVPIPAGSTSATLAFTADEWYSPGFGCFARDFHVWAQNGGAPVPTTVPTTTATTVPTLTATPLPPTASPTMVPTSTVVSPTTIPTLPASTPTATPVPTVVPSCEVRVRINGVEGWMAQPPQFCIGEG